LARFNEFATSVGAKTSAHLSAVKQRLVALFASHKVSAQRARHIRHDMRKPRGTATREHVGAAHSAFAAARKVRPADATDVLASKAPKSHKEMMTDHGLDPQTATSDAFIKICECAETKDALKHPSRSRRFKSDDCSSMEHPNKKAKKKATAGHHELNLFQQERKKEQAK
jgi:hypothetical protein